MIPFKNLINDAYCRDISIKIRSHLEVKRKNGEYIGAFTPYGYQKDSDNKNKLVIDAYAAGIVKEIYRMKLSGMSQTAIANALNKQGVLSPMEYKHSLGIRIQDNFKTHEQAEWSAMSVKRILENEVYTGTLVQGKRTTPNHKVKKLMKKPETDWVRIEKNHEAIVSEREFALVQRLLGIDTRTSPNEEKVYPLSGLVVCGDCGAMMIKRDVPAGGKVYAYYICSRHAATKACAAHRIPMGKLEETVLELVKIHIENILDMKKIMDFIHEVPFQELDIKELEIRKEINQDRVTNVEEISGNGVTAVVDGVSVAVGNAKLMKKLGIEYSDCHKVGTLVHVAVDGAYAGHILISDVVKPHSKEAIAELKKAGVNHLVMLTGDAQRVAEQVASDLGITKVYSELLPAQKVEKVEELLTSKTEKDKLAFVGDGINDAPVLSRADIGIAMGALGSDAAIEAADIVLMDDDPLKIVKAIRISKKCMRIVYENIYFAIGIKILCLILGALGIANMWLAIFADVGVMVIAVLNAIRVLFVKKL